MEITYDNLLFLITNTICTCPFHVKTDGQYNKTIRATRTLKNLILDLVHPSKTYKEYQCRSDNTVGFNLV